MLRTTSFAGSLLVAAPLVALAQAPVISVGDARWKPYSVAAPIGLCGVRGPVGPGMLSMEVRGDAPHALRLWLGGVEQAQATGGALDVHAMFLGLASGKSELLLPATDDGHDVRIDLRGDDIRAWMHGFTGGSSATLAVVGGAPGGWHFALGGTTAAVNAMQSCILALGLTEAPAPFATSGTASALSAAVVPAGYAIEQTVQIGPDGAAGHLQILEDQRVTPDLRRSLWEHSDDPALVLDGADPRLAGFARRPLLPAQLRLIAPDGHVVASRVSKVPLAGIQPVPIRDLRATAVFYIQDFSTGAGSYSGPLTEMLQPAATALQPVVADDDSNAPRPIKLAQTLKSGWRIAPLRDGTEGIESVSCQPDFAKQKRPTDRLPFVVSYSSYRYKAGRWRVQTRTQSGFWENEVFPDASLFP